MITSRYYYGTLNQRDRKIYQAIYDGIMRYRAYVEVPGVSLNENLVGWIYHCVIMDNPFIFSVGEYAMWHALSEDKKRIKITVLCDPKTEKAYRKKVEDIVNQILSVPGLQSMTDFQKEVFVHDFIINNIEYDHTLGNNGARLEPYTVYGALVEKKAVCEGIAKTVKLLLNLLDVKCIVVSGLYEGEGHSWNIVKIDGWNYHLDVTMDLGRIVHKGMMRYDYFNFRDHESSKHSNKNAHILPKCNAIRNNYLVKTGGFVSNYERLKNYIKRGLKKHRPVLYFKVNRNVHDEFTSITMEQFEEKINLAYVEVVQELRMNTSRFIDDTGLMDIINIEITYLD